MFNLKRANCNVVVTGIAAVFIFAIAYWVDHRLDPSCSPACPLPNQTCVCEGPK